MYKSHFQSTDFKFCLKDWFLFVQIMLVTTPKFVHTPSCVWDEYWAGLYHYSLMNPITIVDTKAKDVAN